MPRPRKKNVTSSQGSSYWERFWTKFIDELISASARQLAWKLSSAITDQIWASARQIVLSSLPSWVRYLVPDKIVAVESLPPPEENDRYPEPSAWQKKRIDKGQAGRIATAREGESRTQRRIIEEVEEKLDNIDDFIPDDEFDERVGIEDFEEF